MSEDATTLVALVGAAREAANRNYLDIDEARAAAERRAESRE
jgi:ketosteroid isomerase-like protein